MCRHCRVRYTITLIINTESLNFDHKDIHQFAQNHIQTVKNLPAMPETWVRSLGWEDPLEKETAAHSSILAWKIPWMAEPVGYCPWGRKRLRHDFVIKQQQNLFSG